MNDINEEFGDDLYGFLRPSCYTDEQYEPFGEYNGENNIEDSADFPLIENLYALPC